MANLTAPLPAPPSKHATYDASAAGKERKRAYRKRTGKYTSTSKYLSKPFLAIDGDTTEYRGAFVYSHLGLSDGLEIHARAGLTSIQILTFLSRNLPRSKDGIAVMFGGSEDFNFWVKDLPEEDLHKLYHSTFRDRAIRYGAFEVRWQRGKAFQIKAGDKLVTINDISSWFQTDFPTAVNAWLPEVSGPWASGTTSREIPLPLRLDLTQQLATVLRARLDKTNLRPRRWTGPGNSVATLFRRYDIKAHMAEVPPAVASASRYAYAGGRIETCHFGAVSDRPSYQYDLRQAYGTALTHVPSLAGGSWTHKVGNPGYHPFALYKVSTASKAALRPSPVFTRGPLGAISFPPNAGNWVWSPEYQVLSDWHANGGGSLRVVEAWVFTPANPAHPFAWIADLYEERLRLKSLGDPAELAVKTVVNAIYGKVCQQLGYLEARGKRKEEIPPYHQLEWAGYVTSFTRAALYRAAMEDLDAVISFETDAIFTSKKLHTLPLGVELGHWKETEYRQLTYVQSGIYSGETSEGETTLKVRGFLPGDITTASLNVALTKPSGFRTVTALETQFIGLGIAAQVPKMFGWRTWVTRDKVLMCEPRGKRIHEICDCEDTPSGGLQLNFWHRTVCPIQDQVSREYPVQWINPDPELIRLEQLRREINEWD